MAGRKYASDYRLEEHILPNGKMKSEPVYQGKYFAFTETAEQILRLRRVLLLYSSGVLLLLLPMLLDNTRLGRTVYVILPVVCTLVPLYLLLAGARRLKMTQTPFIREHRDKTDKRIRGASVALVAFIAAGCLGSVIHFIINGIAANEIFGVACLFLALAVSILLLRHRKLANTQEVDT